MIITAGLRLLAPYDTKTTPPFYISLETSRLSFKNLTGIKNAPQIFKDILVCYGRDPVMIPLQLTNFQSPIGLTIRCTVLGEDPKSHLTVRRPRSHRMYCNIISP